MTDAELHGGEPSSWRQRGTFLFRREDGIIDAATWRLHAGWLSALVGTLTVLWSALRPYAHHDLATSAFLAPLTILAFAYLVLYAFATLLIAVCYVMLSMKRFRDRGRYVGLAGLVPVLVLFAASLHFLRAQTPDVVSLWYVVALDAILVGTTAWTIIELGFKPSRLSTTRSK